jgi:hypothetical protein
MATAERLERLLDERHAERLESSKTTALDANGEHVPLPRNGDGVSRLSGSVVQSS